MKKLRKLFTLALTLAIAISLTVPALASTGTSKVTANYMGISIVVDGKTVIPSDGAGHNIEPFAISGSTYLPVRAVANALGLDVDWDVATKTVILKTGGTPDLGSGTAPKTTGSKEVTISTMDIKITLDGTLVTPLDGAGKPVEPFALNGTTYLPVRAVANALGVEITWDDATKTVSIGKVARYLLKEDIYYNAANQQVEKYVYDYDSAGNCVKCVYTDNTGFSSTYLYTCDAAGNTTTEKFSNTDGYSYTSVYTYDAAGNMLSEKYSDSDRFSYTDVFTYDAAGNVLSEKYSDSEGYSYSESYTYDKYGNVLTKAYSDSDNYSYSFTCAYTYDAKGNILTEKYTDTTGYTSTDTYRYDSRGNEVYWSFSDSDGREEGYTVAYSYDAAGRILKASVAYGADTEIYTYTYDARGNALTESYTGFGEAYSFAYTYDAHNNLTKIVSSDGSYSVGIYAEF